MAKRQIGFSIIVAAAIPLALPAVAQVQNAQVLEFQDTQDTLIPNPAVIPGAHAQLRRHSNGVAVKLSTRGLPPGAYTLWWEIYNAPQNCIGECDFFEDAFNPATQFAVHWAAGGIVGEDGEMHAEAETLVGHVPGEPCPAVPFVGPKVLFGCGLLDAMGAQINVIIKTHGEPSANPEVLYRQMGTIGGACTNPPGAVEHPVDPDPAFRLFPCYDPQVAVFLPQ